NLEPVFDAVSYSSSTGAHRHSRASVEKMFDSACRSCTATARLLLVCCSSVLGRDGVAFAGRGPVGARVMDVMDVMDRLTRRLPADEPMVGTMAGLDDRWVMAG